MPDPSAFVTWSSSDQSDVFSAAGVVMTHAGTRTITAAWASDPATSSSFQVSVTHGPIVGFEFVAPIPQYRTVSPGTLVMLGVEGTDHWGNLVGDATSDVTFTSSVASDKFSSVSPWQLTMTAPGTHVITASYPGYPSATVTLTVTTNSAHHGATPPPNGSHKTTPPPSGSHESGPHPATSSDTETSNETATSNVSDVAPGATHLAKTGQSAPTGLLIVALAMAVAGIALSWIAIKLRRPRRPRS
ncbi:hypothetical protein E4M00_01600 [Leifsonia flava]|uniref:Uncharacterized protein n=1 Tax=Orlajensenia leifsoniae TaxID=2561933 RepID=A0A4Y9R7M6_9MICO|nr:hypothetical protein E4M00_01600 [Leifsonia flava]